MNAWRGLRLPALILVLPLHGQGIPPTGRMTDPQAEALARQALGATDMGFQKQALARLQTHRYRSTRAKEREFVLYAQGILEERLESTAKAAATLRKLERVWPSSPFMGEANVIIGTAELDSRHHREAETRFRRAIAADIPAETKRKAQELLLWTLAEDKRPAEGAEVIRSLLPLGEAKPSERGLVGIMEALCALKDKDGADGTRRSYKTFYPRGPFIPRLDLDWALLLGGLGEIKASAEGFRQVIMEQPYAPEADEARLALATLLAEGKLPKTPLPIYGDAATLLAEVRKSGKDDATTRRVLLTQMRLHVNNHQWKPALDLAAQLKHMHLSETDSMSLAQLRADAFRGFSGDLLAKAQPDPLLPYLDRDTVRSMPLAQRKTLLKLLVEKGLPGAAKTVVDLSPPAEQTGLLHAALAGAVPEGDADGVISLMPPKGETAQESLQRAQAELVRGDWAKARAALSRAKPGPDRIAAVLALLRRPPEKDEPAETRLREAEGWLSRAREKGAQREPLAILVADLRAKAGRWSGALALYPAKPRPESLGWVALMRATCQVKLGKPDAAKATLQACLDEPAFRMERMTLGKSLGMN